MNISDFLGRAKLGVDERSGLLSVELKNVSIEGEAVALKLRSPLKLQVSSVEPFTRLERSVYVRMRAVFKAKAAARGIQEVGGVVGGKWDTCFNASTIGFSRAGPAVPPIELGLVAPSGGVIGWSVFGFNSMVAVSESVSCWAFVDAGAGKASVLGSFQQQGGLFEFDVARKQLGFTGVLDVYRTTCSNFIF
ncbi:hypothetical protein L7F22_018767 [Adiantum nelumboides]|nr:hypothetical protein [Adiantum nelumboides]